MPTPLKRKPGRPKRNLSQRVYRLMVTPQTYARYARNEAYIPAKAKDTPEEMEDWEWKLYRKVDRYNKYKHLVLQEALRNDFIMPNEKVAVIFFIPVSPSWSGAKKRRHHLMPHEFKPDRNNLMKALEDSLRAKYTGLSDDCKIWNACESKRWVNATQGWIEIHIQEYNWDGHIVQMYKDHPELLENADENMIAAMNSCEM